MNITNQEGYISFIYFIGSIHAIVQLGSHFTSSGSSSSNMDYKKNKIFFKVYPVFIPVNDNVDLITCRKCYDCFLKRFLYVDGNVGGWVTCQKIKKPAEHNGE